MASFVVAITGGVASGKSAVSSAFERLGIPVADADVAARQVVAPPQPALAEVVARFGAGVILADGTLDRARLRALVFEDASARRDLERILHPRIRQALASRCLEADTPYALAAIPLLVESWPAPGFDWIDRVLVVDCPRAVQMTRLLARDGIDAALANRMIDAQAERGMRLSIADDVIVNDGPIEFLDSVVQALHRRYGELALRSND